MTALAALSTLFVATQQPAAKFTSQNNTDFAKLSPKKGVQLVDVRTTAEYASGHIPGAANMDVQSASFDKQSATLDKSRPVAVYYRSGAHSKTAARKLTAEGVKVYELDKEISNWNGKTEK